MNATDTSLSERTRNRERAQRVCERSVRILSDTTDLFRGGGGVMAHRRDEHVRAALFRRGVRSRISRGVARLMRAAGLKGASRRRWTVTTVRDRSARPAPDLVERNFTASAPDRLWRSA